VSSNDVGSLPNSLDVRLGPAGDGEREKRIVTNPHKSVS